MLLALIVPVILASGRTQSGPARPSPRAATPAVGMGPGLSAPGIGVAPIWRFPDNSGRAESDTGLLLGLGSGLGSGLGLGLE